MKNNGGSAFPRPYSRDDRSDHFDPDYAQEGMSLRDYFAAKAPSAPIDFPYANGESDSYQRQVRWNYFYADAMLVEREK